jgi:hypothetical protein
VKARNAAKLSHPQDEKMPRHSKPVSAFPFPRFSAIFLVTFTVRAFHSLVLACQSAARNGTLSPPNTYDHSNHDDITG